MPVSVFPSAGIKSLYQTSIIHNYILNMSFSQISVVLIWKLLFATDNNHFNLSKCRAAEPIYNTYNSHTQGSGTEAEKKIKSQKNKQFCYEIVSPKNVRSYTQKSHQHNCLK